MIGDWRLEIGGLEIGGLEIGGLEIGGLVIGDSLFAPRGIVIK